METSVAVNKWGNGLGLHLPKAFVQTLNIHDGDRLHLKIKQETIQITKRSKQLTLSEMMEGVTGDIMHSYFEDDEAFGIPAGREVW